MSQKTTTQTTNAYNQAAYGAYNAFQPQLMSSWLQMSQNPLGNSFFQHQLAQQQSAANQINQRSVSNSLQNLRAGGGILSNAGGLTAAMLTRNNIAGSNLQANAFNSALNSSLQNRNSALSSMAAYQPLQTGQTSTQTQGGLGSWLGPIAGAALNFAAPGLGSMLGGGSFSSGYSQNPWSARPASGSMNFTNNNGFGNG